MNDLIVRDVQVSITPTVSEIAKLIWDMDADEQAFLLYLWQRSVTTFMDICKCHMCQKA